MTAKILALANGRKSLELGEAQLPDVLASLHQHGIELRNVHGNKFVSGTAEFYVEREYGELYIVSIDQAGDRVIEEMLTVLR